MSSSNYPFIVPSDFDIEDAFSSTNTHDYTPASPDYFSALPGNTPPDSSNDLTKDLLASLALSPFHDDPYFFRPVEILPPKKQAHGRLSSSTSALPQVFEIGESFRVTRLERHEEQIEEISNHLDELSLDRIEHMEDKIKGLGSSLPASNNDKVTTKATFDVWAQRLRDILEIEYEKCACRENVKSRSDKTYHAVPPPYTGNYMPPKPDPMFIDEQVKSEYVNVVSNVSSSAVKTVELKVKSVNVKNKSVYSTIETKPVRKNNFRNKCYLTDYEDYDVGFVSFGDGKGRISGKEAVRTMLVDSKLPTTFWAKAVNTAFYVLNRALVIKPHNKTSYKLIRGRPPLIDFMKPFGCPVTILNTKDYLGKFDEKADEGFFVGYSMVSKAMRVFNKRIRIVEETLNIRFLENAPNVKGNKPDWLFDIDSLTISMNYVAVVAGFQTNGIAGTNDDIVAGPKDSVVDAEKKATETSEHINNTNSFNTVSSPVNTARPSFVNAASPSPINAVETPASTNAFEEHPFEQFSPFKNAFSLPHVAIVTLINDTEIFGNAYDDGAVEEEVDMNNVVSSYTIPNVPLTLFLKDHPKDQFKLLNAWTLVDLPKDKWAIGTKWVFRNKKDERGIVIKNKARLVDQGHTLEEGIDYDEIEKEVYVCQPLGFKDPDFLDKVYKVEKALYGLHQALRAWSGKTEWKKATTTASSLEAEHDSGNINRTQSMATINEPLPQGTSLGSGPRYALTVNPTLYASCVKQFSTTTKVKKANGQEQIQALVDKQKVFTNIRRQGHGFSWNVTLLFETMMVNAQEKVGKGLGLHTNSHHTPTNTQLSSSKPQKKIKPKRKRRQATEVHSPCSKIPVEESIPTPSNDPLPYGEDSIQLNELMIFCTNLQQHVVELEEAKIAQAKEITKLKKRVKKLEKRKKSRHEDASKHKRSIEDIDQDAKIAPVDESQGRMHDADMFGVDDLEGNEVFVDVREKIYEKEVSSADLVTTAGEVVTAASVEDSAAPTTATTADVDNELTQAKTIIAIKAAKPKVISTAITTPRAKGIVFHEQVQAHIPTVSSLKDKGKAKMIELEKPLKKKDQITLDEEVARKRKYFAAKRAEEIKNKPPTKAQQKSIMCTYMKNMEGFKQKDFKQKRFDDIKNIFDKVYKRVNTFVYIDTENVMESLRKTQAEGSSKRTGQELEQESTKKQKLAKQEQAKVANDDTAELKRCLEIVHEDDDDVAIEATPISSKSPTIVDYKIYREGKKS
nr:ribonuclease H-like domain-containing protein [Tanacetum cinerariifolium]